MDARGWPHRGREKQLTRAASRTQTFTNRGRTLGDREGKKLIFHSPTAPSFFPLCYFCAFLFHCSQLIVPEREAILFFSPSILQFLLLFSSVFTRSDVKSISSMQGGQLCQKWRKEGRKEGRTFSSLFYLFGLRKDLSPLLYYCLLALFIALDPSFTPPDNPKSISILSLIPFFIFYAFHSITLLALKDWGDGL